MQHLTVGACPSRYQAGPEDLDAGEFQGASPLGTWGRESNSDTLAKYPKTLFCAQRSDANAATARSSDKRSDANARLFG